MIVKQGVLGWIKITWCLYKLAKAFYTVKRGLLMKNTGHLVTYMCIVVGSVPKKITKTCSHCEMM